MNIFIEEYKSCLVIGKESPPNTYWGKEHCSMALDSPAPTSGLEPETEVLASVSSSRLGAVVASSSSLWMQVKNRVHNKHAIKRWYWKENQFPGLFSVPSTPKVPLAFSWKVAGCDEPVNRYLSPPYPLPLCAYLQWPESVWALWEHCRQGSLLTLGSLPSFWKEHHCGSRKFQSWRYLSRLSGPNLFLK